MLTAMTCVVAGALALGTPPVFTDQSFEEAKAAATEGGRFLLVGATAEWCGPCKQMERTTWVDDQVVNWIEEHAIAVRLDVDDHPDVARELRIRALPTIMVFKDGQEFDRVVGGRSADQMLGWLEDARAGRTSLDALREQADEKVGEQGLEARLDLARGLLGAGRHGEAAEQYEWLWLNMLEEESAYIGVRVSFMASEMEELAADHPPARERFTALRDQTETRLKQEPRSWDDLTDWIVLNGVIGDEDATLSWVDRIKGNESGKDTLRRVSYLIDGLLLERERWADYGLILGDPLTRLQQEYIQIDILQQMEMDEEQMARVRGFVVHGFIESAGNLHASLLAAGREDEAWQVAEEAVKMLDDPAMAPALVRAALRAGEPRARHQELLSDVEGQQALVDDLKQALEEC